MSDPAILHCKNGGVCVVIGGEMAERSEGFSMLPDSDPLADDDVDTVNGDQFDIEEVPETSDEEPSKEQ